MAQILGYRERVSVHVLVGGFSDSRSSTTDGLWAPYATVVDLAGTLSGLRLGGRLVALERSLILWSTRVVLLSPVREIWLFVPFRGWVADHPRCTPLSGLAFRLSKAGKRARSQRGAIEEGMGAGGRRRT